jgi:cytochrome oxidase Cu insertion factor (SCO1/SenC/PrrC family)
MEERPDPNAVDARPFDARLALAGLVALALLALLAAGLVGLVLSAPAGASVPAGPIDPARFAIVEQDAPPLDLTDERGRPFSLASLRGHPVLVFFGYTHCPDVCPATVGTLNEVLTAVGEGPRAIFASIDPDRDGVPEMATYLRYLPKAYVGLSGTPDQVAAATRPWGVKYAKVDEGEPGGYGMSHTSDVFLVDAEGRIRAKFPFGTEAAPMVAAVRALLQEAPVAAPSVAPSAVAVATPLPATSVGPGDDLRVLLVSSSVWAGPETPVIVTLSSPSGDPLDPSVAVRARVIGANETATAPDVPVVTILPPGASRASYVARARIPAAGSWRLDLLTADGRKGSVALDALDPGTTAEVGRPAPAIDTPTLADVGGTALAITTQEAPDLRFYQSSTADARAAGRPYVLIVDSARFRVSPACGRALTMAGYLLDRWSDQVTFVHLEPFPYTVVTNAPVLSGDIADPPLNEQARAFGLGDAVWPSTDMPWIFVVDGDGILRAKYRGVVGTADVDLILSEITGRGVTRS